MALATRCPQCGAMFRVVADQLKLRGGLVRCGQCRTVFDAIGSLAYVEDGSLPGGKTADAAPTVAEGAGRSGAAPQTAPAAAAAAATTNASATPSTSAAPAIPASAPTGAAAPAAASASRDAKTETPASARAAEPPSSTPSPASAPAAAPSPSPSQDAGTGSAPARDAARAAPHRSRRAESRSPAAERRSRDANDQQRKALGPATTLRIAPGAAPVATVSQVMPAYVERRAAADAEPEQAQLGVPTLLAAGVPTTESDPMLAGIEVIEVPPLPEVPVARPTEEEEPAFIRSSAPRRRRGFSIVFSGGSLLLLLLALAQTAFVFRSELTTRWPQMRPLMSKVCDAVGCTLGLPTRPDQLAVIASELQAVAGTDVLELTAVIRNRASFTQALPALEVTLSDTQNRALARKVFAPVDYLAAAGEPSSRIQEGLAAGGDLTIRVLFEARGLRPAGFLVYPFYI